MAKRCDLIPARTYANEQTLERAVEAKFANTDLRYHVAWTQDGRCYPIFMGAQAMQHGVHFYFPVIGG